MRLITFGERNWQEIIFYAVLTSIDFLSCFLVVCSWEGRDDDCRSLGFVGATVM